MTTSVFVTVSHTDVVVNIAKEGTVIKTYYIQKGYGNFNYGLSEGEVISFSEVPLKDNITFLWKYPSKLSTEKEE